MFLIMMNYIKPLTEIDEHLVAHRAHLEEGYQKNYFVVSGPRQPREGGIIISQLTDRDQLEKIMRADPFVQHQLATYDIIEFTPVKYHHDFAAFVPVK